MIDDKAAPMTDELFQRLLHANRPLDSVCLLAAIEVIDDHVIAREVGMPGIPGLRESTAWRSCGYIDRKDGRGGKDFGYSMRRRHPVVVVDPVDDKDAHFRALGGCIARRSGQERERPERELPSGNSHE